MPLTRQPITPHPQIGRLTHYAFDAVLSKIFFFSYFFYLACVPFSFHGPPVILVG